MVCSGWLGGLRFPADGECFPGGGLVLEGCTKAVACCVCQVTCNSAFPD